MNQEGKCGKCQNGKISKIELIEEEAKV